ncbi:hypothetical protein MATL_G00240930 [Megalops atlanticus]|uniref:Ubiquitin-like protease family profile domain-containing protein n=1 Tax=Megalops atlanticus TaxID=7932 RepID=A0A9D3PDV6_MEGAT|nr:hypothetical protein MATL_G00240930 [Megalops atlanticus]
MMWHRNVKRLKRAATAKASFATLHRTRLRVQVRGVLFWKRRSRLQQLAFQGSKSRGLQTRRYKRKWTKCGPRTSEVNLKKETRHSARSQRVRSAHVTVELYPREVRHDIELAEDMFPGCTLKTYKPEDNPSPDTCTSSECPLLLSERSTIDAHILDPRSTHFKLNAARQLMDGGHLSGTLPEEVEQKTKQVAEGSRVKQPKGSGSAGRHKKRAPLLLMRHKRLSRFDSHFWCRVRPSCLGSCRRGRRAKNLPRVSTLRHKRRKAEALRYLSSLSTESRDLPRELNGRDMPKGSTSEGDGGEPTACQAALQGWSQEVQKKGNEHVKDAEQVSLAANGDPAGGADDMEVESPVPCPAHCTSPLRDHRYCKTTAGAADVVTGESSETKGEISPDNKSLTKEVTNETLKELIHEYLEHFYERYGSFIPLSKSDVLKHLNKRLNTDLKDRQVGHKTRSWRQGDSYWLPLSQSRKSFIYTEVTKYQAGLASTPMHYFKVAYNKHTLTLEDLSTLDNQNWLNDQVINMYGELIMEAANNKVHFFNSFFHRQLVTKGYEGVKRWTKKVDLFSKRLLLIPVHLEVHWSLITVDISSKTIRFYDSQGMVFKHAMENVFKYMTTEAKEKKCTTFQKGWKTTVNKRIPQQKNDNDCGVFVLEYCKCLASGKPLQFSQADMPKIRKRIYKELCDCKLTD